MTHQFSLNIDALFAGDHNSPAIPAFIEQFSDALYAGKGGYSTFLKRLDIGPDFPLRCFVGISETDFTPPRRLLAEAYCQHLLGIDLTTLWVTDCPWKPLNLSRTAAPLAQCVFDIKWALSLGLSRTRWENDVLLSNSALTRQERLPSREGIFGQNVRLLLALAIYGFADPWQFFTAYQAP